MEVKNDTDVIVTTIKEELNKDSNKFPGKPPEIYM